MDASLIDDCVHCGFCLPTCPTYELWHEEMDSPRGRIWLMKATLDGTVELNRTVAEHFDRCLGCMACLTSCPSGVQYDRLIELARERVEQEVPRPLGERLLRALVFAVFPHPRRLRLALRFSALPAPGPFRPLKELAPRWREAVAPPRETPAVGRAHRARRPAHRLRPVGALRRGQPRVGARARRLRLRGRRALRRLLRRARPPRRPARGGARARAPRRPRRSPPPACEMIVTNAAGCGSHLKDARPRPAGRRHLRGARARPRARAAPARAPRRLPGVVPPRPRPARARRAARAAALDPRARARRAGRAGALLRQRRHLQPRPAGGGARRSATARPRTCSRPSPDLYVSANPGCLLQVSAALRRAGRPLPAAHPVELLDASIRGVAPPERALESDRGLPAHRRLQLRRCRASR